MKLAAFRRLAPVLVLGLPGLAILSGDRLGAQVVLNEVLAANRLTNQDGSGDASDWIELQNIGETAVDLEGFALSDDSRVPLKWMFPRFAIEPGQLLLVWCSGKDRIFPTEEEVVRIDSPVTFLPSVLGETAEWRFFAGAAEEVPLPAGWHLPEFDDAHWASGIGPFGFGEEDLRTVIPSEGTGAVLLRVRFDVPSLESVQNLVLSALYDDGFAAFLNGERVLDAGTPVGEELTFASRATRSREASRPQRWVVDDWIPFLRPGENVLAVVVLNSTSASRDLVFSAELGTVPNVFHTNFRIDRDSETLVLYDPRIDDFADGMVLPPQTEDHSYGRYPDGFGPLLYLLIPTPGGPNDSHATAEMIPESVEFLPGGGRYSPGVQVALSASVPVDGFEIRYTLDGRTPQATSPLYTGPIEIRRNTVLRAAGFASGVMVLHPASRSYFVAGMRSLALPVLSVSMEPLEFQAMHLDGNGRGRRSERESFLEVFTEEGLPGPATGFGIRLHGGAGRNGDLRTKKAYKAYFRRAYGDSKLRYPLIPDTPIAEFDKLVLRSNFNDAFRTGSAAALIRDQVIRDLHEDMGALVSHGGWYNLIVNMEYRGLYNVVERMDRVFFASYFPEDGESWDVIKTGNDVLDGTSVEWNRMVSFFQRSQLADEALYSEALDLIDVENYTSYMILNIWAQNHDWPHNNWYAARPQREEGKWIFLSWDAEFGIGRNPSGFSADTFSHVLSRTEAALSIIFASLLRSPHYGRYFLQELERHLEGALAPENALARIQRQAEIIAPDVPEEVGLTGNTFSTWQGNLRTLETFAVQRGDVLRRLLLNSPRLPVPRVLRVVPDRIVLADPVEVRLFGVAFGSDTRVAFGGIDSPSVTVDSSREIHAMVPADLRLEGRPAIEISAPDQPGFVSEGLLEVVLVRPEPLLLLPPEGSESGGDVVTIYGSSFLEGARVEFGGVPAPRVTLLGEDGEALEVLTPPGTGIVDVRVFNTRPGDLPAKSLLEFEYIPESGARFVRGDADSDGRRTASDAVTVLAHLFHGRTEPDCASAADSDDSGSLDVADAVYLLGFLFQRGAAPPPPFPGCGGDPTPDSLACVRTTACP